jgi:S-adenosylmethionine:tRNA ribosyltransferase-isomerase
MRTLAFPELQPACAPAEIRGRSRSDVALLVASRSDGELHSVGFNELPRFLRAGDLLVVNTSATIPAALPASIGGADVWVHLSTPLRDGHEVVEVRTADLGRRERPPLGTRIELSHGGWITLLAPYRGSERLTEAELVLPVDRNTYLARHGSPIRYRECGTRWRIGAYQTVFAQEPGSAEMPSAGRPFSAELVARLVARGVLFSPITLHTGVSSLERDETPYPECYRVSVETAQLVNAVHSWGGRVIAVGTTVVRALETTASVGGTVMPEAGWTSEVITAERGLRCVDGLITGWHEPESSHLWMLEAAAGLELVERSYCEAAALGFSGHEFGDAQLIVP